MPKKVSHGDTIKDRTKRLLEAILDFDDDLLDGCENLNINCRWQDKDSKNPKLVIRTTLRELEELSSKGISEGKLSKEQIREALNQMKKFLEILEDNREHEKGSEHWHFTLKLWSTRKEINLEKLTQEWESRRTPKSKQQSVITDVPKIDNSTQSSLSDSSIKKNVWSDEHIEILYKALCLFTDMGKMDEALKIANLLLESDELNIPLREEIETFRRNHKSSWRYEIDDYIDRQQPFKLSYQDAIGKLWNFTVHYAKVVPHEERQYLDCWCQETEGHQDIEQLRHNWSFRLDRISEATIIPINGKWLHDLETIKVEMHLFGSLAHAYKSKQNNDISNEWLDIDGKQVRRLLREVSYTFWFFREVIRYGKDCIIVKPNSLRERFEKNLISLCKVYSLTIPD
jgi:predicted DNA-binding transcriptional regulator YafY